MKTIQRGIMFTVVRDYAVEFSFEIAVLNLTRAYDNTFSHTSTQSNSQK